MRVEQRGFGVVGVMIAVGVMILGIGTYATLSSSTPSMPLSDSFEADPTMSGIENMAQNIAENATNDAMAMVDEQVDMMAEAMEVVDMAMNDDMAATEPADVPATVAAGTFEPYSADKLALAQNGTVVLFFHAEWCPSCRGLENDINAQLSQIPANTHILKLDYDTETELKRKYGVVRQHTLVVVDANGNEIKKLTGLTNTLAQVTSQL